VGYAVSTPLLVVLSFDVDAPERAVEILKAVNPPGLPWFAGQARVVVGDGDPERVVRFLESDTEIPKPGTKTYDQALADVWLYGVLTGVITSMINAAEMSPDQAREFAQHQVTRMVSDPAVINAALPGMRHAWETDGAMHEELTTDRLGGIRMVPEEDDE
jgi:hypothetical protein